MLIKTPVAIMLLFAILTASISCTKINPANPEAAPDQELVAKLKKKSSLRSATFEILTDEVPKFEGADIIQLHNGTLLSIFSNNYEHGDHTAIYKSTSNDGGITWTTPATISMSNPYTTRDLLNTNIFQAGNRIFLIIQNIKKSDRPYIEGDNPLISYSDDNGQTWSTPAFMLSTPHEFVIVGGRNCTITKTGRLIVPVAYGQHIEPHLANILYSDNNGATWIERANPLGLANAWFAEPSIAQLNDGRLMILIRTRFSYIYKSYSSDDGNTWTTPVATTLQSPWAAHTMRVTPEGYIVVVHTNAPAADYCDPLLPRNKLGFAVSYDHGETWTDQAEFVEYPNHEYQLTSPSITFLQDKVLISFLHGGMNATYTDNAIKTAIFDKSDVFTSIHDYVQEDWHALGSWVTTGTGTIGIINNDTLQFGDNTSGITSVYKIQKLAARYTLEFKAKVNSFVNDGYINTYSTLGTTFSDGVYRLMIKLENNGIYVVDNTGTWVQYGNSNYLSSKNAWHVWKAVVNNGTAAIYMDNQLVVPSYQLESTNYNAGKIQHWSGSSASMPTNSLIDYTYFTPAVIESSYDDWTSLSSWTLTGTGTHEISDGNTLHVSDNTGGITGAYRTQSLASRYTLQFRARIETFVPTNNVSSWSTLGTTFSDGNYRLMIKLETDGIYVAGPTGNWVQYANTSYINSKHDWHVWKVTVNNGVAQVYMDGVQIITNHSIESTNYNAGRLEHWTSASSSMTPTSCYIDYTSYFAN